MRRMDSPTDSSSPASRPIDTNAELRRPSWRGANQGHHGGLGLPHHGVYPHPPTMPPRDRAAIAATFNCTIGGGSVLLRRPLFRPSAEKQNSGYPLAAVPRYPLAAVSAAAVPAHTCAPP